MSVRNRTIPMKSQLGQDLFVLERLRGKQDGFFVDIGAYDGEFFSNTYSLERLGWQGICVEPSAKFEQLQNCRSCICENALVGGTTGEMLPFYSGGDPLNYRVDLAADPESENIDFLPAISINDLLEKFSAPEEIDYISIDTEGTEWDILEPFDFDRWRVKCWTIEHGFRPLALGSLFLRLSERNYYCQLVGWEIFAFHRSLCEH